MLRRVLRGKSFLVKLVVVDVQGGKEGQRKETDLKKKKRKAGKNGVVKLWRGREGRKDGEGFPSLFFKSPSTFFLNQNTESQSFLEHG